MKAEQEKFEVLLCSRKDLMERVRRLWEFPGKVHLQYVSSPSFVLGRAIFNAPDALIMEVGSQDDSLRTALHDFHSRFPGTFIIALDKVPDYHTAVEVVRTGAGAYFDYPKEERKLREQLRTLFGEWIAARDRERYNELQQETYDFRTIVGESALLRSTIEKARKIIKNNAMTVLITGETGTGKELFARAIHFNGRTKDSPFVDISCSALPETLLESELFGYEKGAFTDAKERKMGLFELAADGTVFLDEIGDVSASIQSKLLKVVENRIMRRLGGVRDIPVRARIIAATSANLEAKMKAMEFRRDLYHRLKILPLELPPLRARIDDIPILATGFLSSFNSFYGKRFKGVSTGALQSLMEHEWEGNVRELKHTIERAVLLAEGEWIDENDLELPAKTAKESETTLVIGRAESESERNEEQLVLMVPISKASVDNIQRMLARKVFEYSGGNKLKAASMLKISRPRLDRLLRQDEDE